VLKAILGFILVLFIILGYVLSWAFFSRNEDLAFMERIAISFVLSMASVILSVLFIDLVLGVDTPPENIAITILAVTGLAVSIWKLEVTYLRVNLKQQIDKVLVPERRAITIDISNMKRKFRAGLQLYLNQKFERNRNLKILEGGVELQII
jgi:uncharacterized membrane protein